MIIRALLAGLCSARWSPCLGGRRHFHGTVFRSAITHLLMPAMSPTMTEGAIARWKKKEGESFATGDVLLEIETDKAVIDVEAQYDGIMGKILAADGTKNVSVGKIIALLAEEGDDISNLDVPKEPKSLPSESVASSSPSPPSPPSGPSQHRSASHHGDIPKHLRPLFPSVHRLLLENNVSNIDKIKGTGVRGMLTKGDVLSYLGKASSPTGTFKEAAKLETKPTKIDSDLNLKAEPLDGAALRKMIVSGLQAKAHTPAPGPSLNFDSVIADYFPSLPGSISKPPIPLSKPTKRSVTAYFDGLV